MATELSKEGPNVLTPDKKPPSPDFAAFHQESCQLIHQMDLDGRMVSDFSDEEDDSVTTPLDFRKDWSEETKSIRRWLQKSPKPLIISPEPSRERGDHTQEESYIGCDTDSIVFDYDFLDPAFTEQCESGQDDTLITPATSSSTRSNIPTDYIIDCNWVEPEYPEVWKVGP